MAKTRIRKIGNLVNQLISRRGYGQSAANEQLHAAITSAIAAKLACFSVRKECK